MKTKAELDALKKELDAVAEKLSELSENELEEVTGGVLTTNGMPEKRDDEKYVMGMFEVPGNMGQYEFHFYAIKRNTK